MKEGRREGMNEGNNDRLKKERNDRRNQAMIEEINGWIADGRLIKRKGEK